MRQWFINRVCRIRIPRKPGERRLALDSCNQSSICPDDTPLDPETRDFENNDYRQITLTDTTTFGLSKSTPIGVTMLVRQSEA